MVEVGLIKDQKISTNTSQVLKSQKNFLLLSIHNPFIKKLIKNLKQNLRQILGKVCLNQKNLIKKKYTLKRKVNSKELKRLLGKNYKNPNLNLDIDFSVSKGGYRLRPHRDDINRIYNFLIYLTDIPKKNGGSLTLFKKKANRNLRKSFRRFPKIDELDKLMEFTPKKGSVIFFKSTPNSYHGLTRFKENNTSFFWGELLYFT